MIGRDDTVGTTVARIVQVDTLGNLKTGQKQMIHTKTVSDNTLTVFGDGTNDYIDTAGYSKAVFVLTGTSGSAAASAEWANTSSFTAGHRFIVNGFSGGTANTSPASSTSTQRADGLTTFSNNQTIILFDVLPARYCRIGMEQSSGGSLSFTLTTNLTC